MKLADLLNLYDHDLREYDAKRNGNTLEHVRWMLDEIRDLSGDKAMRWLGFVQGALWTQGIYTIDQMREHNKGLLEEEAPEYPLVRGVLSGFTIVDTLAQHGFTRSMGRRVIAQRAVKVNGALIEDIDHPLCVGDVVTVGRDNKFTVKDNTEETQA